MALEEPPAASGNVALVAVRGAKGAQPVVVSERALARPWAREPATMFSIYVLCMYSIKLHTQIQVNPVFQTEIQSNDVDKKT